MSLIESARKFYWDEKTNCAVAILLGANEAYGLGLDPSAAALVTGFGGGIGCGKICGCAAGAVSVLGKLFSDREDFRDICAQFAKEFEKGMGCDTIDCAPLSAKYKTEEKRCVDTVVMAAELIDKFIAEHK